MDYKKIIKTRYIRLKVLALLSFIPDSLMVKLQYRIKLGRKLNLKNPKRYTEKLQWYKLYYRNPLMSKCVDKYAVREFVEECGLGNILNDMYYVYDKPEEIDFSILPDKFVIKDTLGGGGNGVIICKDKSKLDESETRKKIKEWFDITTKKHPGREWVYENNKRRIIIEKYIETESGDLPDYKFFCFNGKVYCSYYMENYTQHHELGRLGFLDRNWNLMPYNREDFAPLTTKPEIPKNYEEMVSYAEKLSSVFPAARVDFYNINGKIIFGEITFFMASGYIKFDPDEFDFELGSHFNIDTIRAKPCLNFS